MRLFGFDLSSSGARIGKLFDGAFFVPQHTEAAPLAVLDPVGAHRDLLVDFSTHTSSNSSSSAPQAVAPVEDPVAASGHDTLASQSAQAFIQDDAAIFLSDDTDLFVFSPKDVPAGYVVGLETSTAMNDTTTLSSQPELVTITLATNEIVTPMPVAANDVQPAEIEISNVVPFPPQRQLVSYTATTIFDALPPGIGAPYGGVANQSTFAVDLEIAIGSSLLDPYGKVLFDPTGGDLDVDGHFYMVVDANGIAGYQDGADYVIELFTTNNDLHLGHYI